MSPPLRQAVERSSGRRGAIWLIPLILLAMVGSGLALFVSQVEGTGEASGHAPIETDPSRFVYLNMKPLDQQPVRWNPCAPIHYVVNLSLAPTNGLALVQEAVRRTSVATGISFVFDGPTSASPSDRWVRHDLVQDDASGGRHWAPVVIGWVSPEEYRGLSSDVSDGSIAVSGPMQYAGQYVTGWMGLDAGLTAVTPDWTIHGWGPVIQHEMGHIVGLDHAQATDELMYPDGGTMVDWGTGDLEGLHALGRSSGCLETPEAPAP